MGRPGFRIRSRLKQTGEVFELRRDWEEKSGMEITWGRGRR